MRNSFSSYPKVLYQLIWVILASIICFFLVILDLIINPLILGSALDTFDPSEYFALFVCAIILICGLLFDREKDTRKTFFRGAHLMALGIVISIFLNLSNKNFIYENDWLTILSLHSLFFGFVLILISCTANIGVLFPIANDWKDNAFLLFFSIPIGVIFLMGISIGLFFPNFDSEILPLFLKIGSIIWLYSLLIGNVEIGFSLEDEEVDDVNEEITPMEETMKIDDENNAEESVKETSYILLLLGIAFISFLYGEILYGLPNLGTTNYSVLENALDEFFLFSFIGRVTLVSIFIVTYAVIIYLLLKNATHKSTQFSKLKKVNFALLVLISIEFLVPTIGSVAIDYLLRTNFIFFNIIFISPLLYSVFTHINMNNRIGFWLGLFMATPLLFYFFMDKIFGDYEAYSYSPYISLVVFLILAVILFFKENQWKEKLTLEVPNQIIEEEDVDLLDHFIEE